MKFQIEKTIYGFWRKHGTAIADKESELGVILFNLALAHPGVTFRAMNGTQEIARATPLPG